MAETVPADERARVPVVTVLASMAGLWLCYFLLTTLRAAIVGFEPQVELLWRRGLVTLVGIGMTGLFFASGIFYPLERLPDEVEVWVRLVPTAAAVDLSRSVLLLGRAPAPEALLGPAGVSLAVFFLGYAIFLRSREGFADAL